ncbi:hypothetical protein J2Y58_003529 [Sphingomonas sp. BE138]|uniref:type IV secretion system DNA-binding domain-containing protein n=1 Tax=Sphingomonas sp. BE138 TaxID=2817845 RepID=UPI002859261F|nr:type IV secretion system DNA-binding domain-containing protein [Sphingomonas sp. BE138]MDR6790149.1 hypothetical protein [Sphingomonas sp. BE138]
MMGLAYPFRFRREREPARGMVTFAQGADVDAGTLLAVRAGSGDRLVIVGDGDGFLDHADQTRDLILDPARGNWDFFADHPSDYARSSAIEAFLPVPGWDRDTSYTYAARYVLSRAIEHAGREPGATLAQVRDLVFALPEDAVSEVAGHDPGDPQAQRWSFTVLATVTTPLAGIVDRHRSMPPVSIARWLAGSASTILFVRSALPLAAASREVHAIIASILDHAMLSRLDVTGTLVDDVIHPDRPVLQ